MNVDAALTQIEGHEMALVEAATYDTQEGKRHASRVQGAHALGQAAFFPLFLALRTAGGWNGATAIVQMNCNMN